MIEVVVHNEPLDDLTDQTIPTQITPSDNGAALDERQRETAKEEAAALAVSGDYEAAFHKILELL